MITLSKNNKLIRIAGFCGIIGSALITILVLFATLLSPWFSWEQNALSDLGVGEVALIFNVAVFFGGLLNLIFSIGVKEYLEKTKKSFFGVAFLMIASISLTLVGIFTIDFPIIHALVALSFFLLSPLALLLIGLNFKDNQTKNLSITLGSLSLAAILLLPIALIVLPIQAGFAIPEIIHSIILGIWTIIIATKMLRSKKT